MHTLDSTLRCWSSHQSLESLVFCLVLLQQAPKITINHRKHYYTYLEYHIFTKKLEDVMCIICFIKVNHLYNNISSFIRIDICDKSGVGNKTMCPQCEVYCPYWKLYDSCNLSYVAYVADNYATVAFSVLMALWGKYISFLQTEL